MSSPRFIKKTELPSCYTCGKFVPSSKEATKHPALKTLQCLPCNSSYQLSGDLTKYRGGVDNDGRDNYCRWCLDGGELIICAEDNCRSGFCKTCIKRNLGAASLKSIKSESSWYCFICDDAPLKELCKKTEDFLKPKYRPLETINTNVIVRDTHKSPAPPMSPAATLVITPPPAAAPSVITPLSAARQSVVAPPSAATPSVVAPPSVAAPSTVAPKSAAVTPVIALKSAAVPPVIALKSAAVPSVVAPKSAAVPSVIALKSAAVPPVVSPKSAAVPSVIALKSAAVPPVVSPKSAAVPSVIALKSAAVPSVVSPKSAAVPSVIAPKSAAVPSVVSPKSAAVPSVIGPPVVAVPSVVAPKSAAVPSVIAPPVAAVPSVVAPKSAAVPSVIAPPSAAAPSVVAPPSTAAPSVITPPSTAAPSVEAPPMTAPSVKATRPIYSSFNIFTSSRMFSNPNKRNLDGTPKDSRLTPKEPSMTTTEKPTASPVITPIAATVAAPVTETIAVPIDTANAASVAALIATADAASVAAPIATANAASVAAPPVIASRTEPSILTPKLATETTTSLKEKGDKSNSKEVLMTLADELYISDDEVSSESSTYYVAPESTKAIDSPPAADTAQGQILNWTLQDVKEVSQRLKLYAETILSEATALDSAKISTGKRQLAGWVSNMQAFLNNSNVILGRLDNIKKVLEVMED